MIVVILLVQVADLCSEVRELNVNKRLLFVTLPELVGYQPFQLLLLGLEQRVLFGHPFQLGLLVCHPLVKLMQVRLVLNASEVSLELQKLLLSTLHVLLRVFDSFDFSQDQRSNLFLFFLCKPLHSV